MRLDPRRNHCENGGGGRRLGRLSSEITGSWRERKLTVKKEKEFSGRETAATLKGVARTESVWIEKEGTSGSDFEKKGGGSIKRRKGGEEESPCSATSEGKRGKTLSGASILTREVTLLCSVLKVLILLKGKS